MIVVRCVCVCLWRGVHIRVGGRMDGCTRECFIWSVQLFSGQAVSVIFGCRLHSLSLWWTRIYFSCLPLFVHMSISSTLTVKTPTAVPLWAVGQYSLCCNIGHLIKIRMCGTWLWNQSMLSGWNQCEISITWNEISVKSGWHKCKIFLKSLCSQSEIRVKSV